MNATIAMEPSRRRLAICLLIAAALHTVVALNVDVPARHGRSPPPAIDLILAAPGTDVGGSHAPAIGQQPAVPLESEASALAANDGDRLSDDPASARSEPHDADEPAAATGDVPANRQTPVPPSSLLAGRSAAEIARAITDLDAERGNESASKRVRRLSGVPPADSDLAYYLESWHRKVERVGRINYPGEAKAKRLTGSLRLLVAVAADGALREVRVIASSGHAVLDEAALRIVRLAAPFSPFSPGMRESIDLLEIEHTWQFRRDRLLPAL